jgi:deazaflavin-dependent oxidoreductase (nitroreductase family)
MKPNAKKPLMKVMKVANGMHVALYRMSGGKFANRIANMPVLLITTYGRKSGKPHTNPVVYIKDDQDFLVSASAGGMNWHPGWYFNLRNKPEIKIQVGNDTINVKANVVEGDERTRLYDKFKTASSNFVKYEKGTSRIIPVIRLTPTYMPPVNTRNSGADLHQAARSR